jgi:hypothetical protein
LIKNSKCAGSFNSGFDLIGSRKPKSAVMKVFLAFIAFAVVFVNVQAQGRSENLLGS